MIPVHDALRILSEVKVYPATETVNLAGACNRILAGEILATVNMPPFD
jgi:molybdopterin biosynthesis enzyme